MNDNAEKAWNPTDNILSVHKVNIGVQLGCMVFSITEEGKEDNKRVQAIKFRIILKHDYSEYENALLDQHLHSLNEIKQMLALRFAKQMFEEWQILKPIYQNKLSTSRNKTGRLKKSSVPENQRE